MSEIFPDASSISAWSLSLEAAVCDHCDWSYLLAPALLPLHCPHCLQALLTPLEREDSALPYDQPPERYLPFTVTPEQLARKIEDFAGGIWFAPGDLNPANLKERLQRLYLPMWLVDSQVQATWQAEVGYNYEVVSHRDKFDDRRGGWVSQRVTETRVRWEPRLGRLKRTYDNIPAPALEEHSRLMGRLGPYDPAAAQPYQPEALAEAMVRLPNRPPPDAWPDALPTIQRTAADECRRACQADHWRDFRWDPAYPGQNWTLLLLPVYVTYYLDDEQDPKPLLIHGQSGRLSGPRRASMKRAMRASMIIAAVAVLIFILSLIAAVISFFISDLFILAGIGMIAAISAGLLALIPLVIVWQFNRTNLK